LKKLKTGNSNELEVLKFYESENYKRIEKWFHMKYASRKTIAKNEFFSLTDDQVINFIKDCKEIDSVINLMKEQNPFYK
jgi:RNA processing factor Prp31